MIKLPRSMPPHLLLLLGLVRSATTELGQGHPSPLETMSDVTNDFGVCVLQLIASPSANTVFSPYGLVSMALLVYEGATGQSAAEVYNTLHLPWHRDIVRIGFRDLHRYLRSYFSSEGFLKGLVLSKPNVSLRHSYVEVLKFYGFQPDTSITQPVIPTQSPSGKETTITTSMPETTQFTTQTMPTTLIDGMTTPPTTTSSVKVTMKPGKSNETTTVDTTTTIETVTNTLPTTPETLDMQGPSNQSTTKNPPTTTMITTKSVESTMIPTTSTSKTTTMRTTTTITTQLPKTTLPMTSGPPPKTTREINSPKTTTLPTEVSTVSIDGEMTKSATEYMQAFETTLEIEKQPMTKTTIGKEMTTDTATMLNEIFTSDDKVTKQIIQNTAALETTTMINQQTSQEMEMAPDSMEEMNVITIADHIPPTLESMSMILNITNDSAADEHNEMTTHSQPTSEYEINEITTQQMNETVPEVVPSDVGENKVTTEEVFTEQTLPDTVFFSTMIVDTTIPIEDVVILNTPPDVEVISNGDSPMLGELILMEEGNKWTPNPEFATDNMIDKRTTEHPKVATRSTSTKNPIQNSEYEVVDERNETKSTESDSSLGEQQSENKNSSGSLPFGNTDSISKDQENRTEQYISSFSTNSEDIVTGFPTLEPDRIIFPTLKVPRLRRAVKSKKSSGETAQLGNWVGGAGGWGYGWRQSPTHQWFWTFSGDKLVPVLSYTAHLPYADLPALQAAAVQLPLDDDRYSLMILLPKQARGLKQVLYSLQWHSLRTIFKSLKPTPVYAVVPTFTIVKHINLTPALHKLGIRSIFDAYLANLCELSSEPNLYVRSVEQVITISVQKYFTNNKWFEASPGQIEHHFLATHPFAYFVVDTETQVALVAGTLVDPLLSHLPRTAT